MLTSFEVTFMEYKILKPHQPEDNIFLYSNKYRFYYVKTKDVKLEEIKIIGELDLTQNNNDNPSDVMLELISKNGKIKRYNVNSSISEIKDFALLIYVGKDEYLVLNNKKNILFIKIGSLIIPTIILLSISISIYSVGILQNIGFRNIFNPIIENAGVWDGKLPMNNSWNPNSSSNENINIPGYSHLYVNTENRYIKLINPTSNDVYFKYILELDGIDIFKSNMIEPGKALDVDVFNLLKTGSYTINLKIETYDIKTMSKCNGASQKVNIEVN